MIRPFVLAVVLFAFSWPGGAIAQEATPVLEGASPCGQPSGWLLTQSTPTADRQSTVTVIDPATTVTIDEIELPPLDRAFPTEVPGKALAIAGRDLFLIDARDGLAIRIDLPDGDARELSPNPVQFRGTAGQRFVLLGSPGFDRALLIDVEDADATSLPALIGATAEAPAFVSFAAVTPDDAHVLFWDGRAVFLASTANPSDVQQISTAPFAFAPESSPDGREIVFSQSEGPGSGSAIVIHDIETQSSREVLNRDRALVTLWPPGGRTLLVDARTESGAAAGSVSLLDVDSGEERVVLRYSGSLTTVQFTPTGARALLGVERIDGGEWHLLDLSSAAVTQITQLAGSRIYPGLYGDARWGFAVPLGETGDPLSGPAFRSIDLESGSVARLLPRDPALTYDEPPLLSPDGRLVLITGRTGYNATLWLLDAVNVAARSLATGASVSAVWAPDACHVAISAAASTSGGPEPFNSIVPVDGGPAAVLDGGRIVAWV